MSKANQLRLAILAQDRELVDGIAQVCYEVNRAYCQAISDNSSSFDPWDSAPEWQKETNRLGVKYLLTHPDATPEDTHESWLAEKVRTGWVWGEVKDPELKTHPCIKPYRGLLLEQRVKDHLFKAIVQTLVDVRPES